jgi:hypothetical protein
VGGSTDYIGGDFVAVEIANAVLNITPSMRGLSGEIDRQIRGVNTRRAGARAGEDYSSGFGSAAKKLTGILAGAFAAVQIKDFAVGAINQASDLQEVGTKLTAVFGDAAADITAFGAQGAKALGQTSLQAQNAAATFGTFGKAAGLSGKENAAFSTELAKLATDMASFSNTTPEQAIEALGAGLRGESEPLRAYGVLLDDASLRQEALAMGLITTTKDALTPQQKVLASHALIMKQTTDAQGDFERTSGGLANQQRILAAQWEDSKGKLGEAFLPGVTAVVTALNEKLGPAMDTIVAGLPGFTAAVSENFGEVKGYATDAWAILSGDGFEGGKWIAADSPLVGVLSTLREFGLDAFDRLREIWDTLWDTAEKLWVPIQSIATSLFDAVETISGSGLTAWDLFLDALQGIADLANTYLVPAFDAIALFMRENPEVVITLVGALVLWKTTMWAIAAATKAWAVAQGILNAVMAANPISLIIVALAAFAAAVVWAYNNVEWFRDLVDYAWTKISEAFTGAWESVIKPVFQFISENIHVVGDFFSWLWETVSNVWQWISDKVSTVWNWLRDNIFAPLGTAIGNTGTFFSDLWTTVSDVWGWIETKISDVWNWLYDNVFSPLYLAVAKVGTFFGDMWTTISEIWTKVQNFFVNIGEGIGSAVDTVETAIDDIVKAIDEFFQRFTNWGGTESGGVFGNIDLGAGPGFAEGGVIPGSDPGRRDNMLVPMRSGESVFVPEFTRAIGGESTVHAWNRLAEQGRLGQIGIGLARGGVVGQSFHDLITSKVDGLLETKKNEITSMGGGGFTSNGQWGPANYGGFAANTAAAKAFIEGHFSGVSSIGGLYGGSVPGSDHPAGKALDVMIANYLSSQGIQAGSTIADWFVNNPAAFGTKYVIWRDRINQGGQWAPYSHPGGNNDTLAHRDHVHLSFLTGDGVFSGSPVGDKGAGGIAYNPAGGWEQWRPTVLQALSIIGQPAGLANTVLNQIRTESSGNPRAINLTDSNARRGTPSKGLIQTIDPTFQAYRLPQLANDPYDPLANIVAGMRYAIDRYGSIAAGMRGVAYDNGGMFAPGSIGVNLLDKPEAVLTPAESAAYQAHAKELADGYSGKAPIQFGDIHVGRVEDTRKLMNMSIMEAAFL